MAAAANAPSHWLEPPPKAKPAPMTVKVTLDFGPKHTYQGMFAHTFDAYDDALQRFPRAASIVVIHHRKEAQP